MALAFVTGATASATASPATTGALAGTVVAGQLIVVTITDDSGTLNSVSAVTDNKGNVYLPTQTPISNSAVVQQWYTKVFTGGTGVTVSATWNTGTTGRVTMEAQYFNGFTGTPTLDQVSNTTGTSTTASGGTTPATTVAAELVVLGVAHAGATSAFSLGTGYTNQTTVNVANAAGAQSSKVVAATGAQTGTATIAASRAWAGMLATFYDAAIGSKMAVLQDSFTNTSLNTGLWTEVTGGSATVSYSSAGAQTNFPGSSTSATVGNIVSNVTYDLSSSYAYLHVVTLPDNATNADAELRLIFNPTNILRWVKEGGTLYAQKEVAGATTTLTSFSFSATTHAWWRIRESGGTVNFETSPDFAAWTTQTTTATSSLFPITNLTVRNGGSCFENETNPGVFLFNSFNVNIHQTTMNNYQFVRVGDGMSASERIR